MATRSGVPRGVPGWVYWVGVYRGAYGVYTGKAAKAAKRGLNTPHQIEQYNFKSSTHRKAVCGVREKRRSPRSLRGR